MPRPHAHRGFTLAESLIASVVLAASVIGIGGTLGVSYKNASRLDESAVATQLARQMIEQIASKPYPDGPDSSDSVFDYRLRTWSSLSSLTTADGRTISLPGGSYRRSSDVQYFDSVDDLTGPPKASLNPLPPIAYVTVAVTCPGGLVVSLGQIIAQTP